MFSLLLSSAYTESRPLLLLTPPHQRAGWGCRSSWEGTQLWELTPAGQRDFPYRTVSRSAYKAGGKKEEGGNVQNYSTCLPQSPLHVMEPCFPGDGWTPACPWEALNEFLVLLCLRTVIDGLAGLVECKTKEKRTEVVKSRRANKGSK